MPLTGQLSTLETDGLIRLAQLRPEVEYVFRHALVQEAAYGSLVRVDRRMLHLAVGLALESLYPARVSSPELTPVLARHFAEAGEATRALNYYVQAGRSAAGVYANAEAIQHFDLALEIAQTLPASGELVTELFLLRGRALELSAQDSDALKNYAALEAWALAGGDRRAQVAALNARATILVKPSTEQHLERGQALSQQALQLAQELGDRQEEVRAMWNLLLYHLAAGSLDIGLEMGERALALARTHQLRELTGYLLTELHKAYYQVGQPDRGQAAGEEARAIWRELGRHNMLADNLSSTGVMHILLGEYEPALALAEEALSLSRAIGNLWNEAYSYFLLDLVHFDRGEVGRALEVSQLSRQLSAQAGFAEGISQSDFNRATIYGEMGAIARSLELTSQLRQRPESTSSLTVSWPLLEALVAHLHLRSGREAEARAVLAAAQIPEDDAELRQWFFVAHLVVVSVRGELALLGGDVVRALNATEALLEHFQNNRVRLFLADALFLRGRLLLACGQAPAAQAALESARAEAESLGSRRSLWKILAELARLAETQGEREQATALWRQAGEIVEFIAAHAGSQALAATFLQRPVVREVITRAGQI